MVARWTAIYLALQSSPVWSALGSALGSSIQSFVVTGRLWLRFNILQKKLAQDLGSNVWADVNKLFMQIRIKGYLANIYIYIYINIHKWPLKVPFSGTDPCLYSFIRPGSDFTVECVMNHRIQHLLRGHVNCDFINHGIDSRSCRI